MKLTLFNGSPRGKESNTRILLEKFTDGFIAAGNNESNVELAYLSRVKMVADHVKLFENAERVILGFPLYTDAMPGMVMNFIEHLEPLCGRENNPDIGFVVQSGFSEPIHSRFVEKYLEKLAERLGCRYLGTVVKGGCEGVRQMPPWMTRKLFDVFHRLGVHFGKSGDFDKSIIASLAKHERMSGTRRFFLTLLSKAGLTNVYWNGQLKKNNAFDKRFATPYAAE